MEAVRQTLNNVGHSHTFRGTRPRVRPDPEGGDQEIEEVSIPARHAEEVVVEGHIVGTPIGCSVAEGNEAAIMVFEDENGVDADNALRDGVKSLERLEFDPNDLGFYFGRVETRMGIAGVKKNFTKFQVLSEILPKFVQDQTKSILRKSETDFPNHDAYKQLKKEVVRIFGPKPETAVERALNRTLTGPPSALARALVDDIFPNKEMDCSGCIAVVSTLWRRQLSSNVKAGIAHCKFNKENFNEIVQLADDIHASHNPGAAASFSVAAVSLNETQPALPYPVPEVAAVRQSGGRGGGGRGGRGNRGWRGNRGGGGRGGAQAQTSQNGQNQAQTSSQPRHKGPKHPDLPPGEWKGCQMHYKWGKSAFFCAEPSSCPWKNVYTPKPEKN